MVGAIDSLLNLCKVAYEYLGVFVYNFNKK
jgi:hypothetical protein